MGGREGKGKGRGESGKKGRGKGKGRTPHCFFDKSNPPYNCISNITSYGRTVEEDYPDIGLPPLYWRRCLRRGHFRRIFWILYVKVTILCFVVQRYKLKLST